MKQQIWLMSGPEVKFRSKQAMAALIPVAGLVDHGPHLAVGTEIELVEEYASKLAQRLSPYLLVPQTIPFETRNGSIFGVNKETLSAILKQVVLKVKELGIVRVAVISMSNEVLETAKESIKGSQFSSIKQKYINILDYVPKKDELANEDPKGKGNAIITSLAMFVNESLVKQDMIKYADSSFGIVGDPKKASKELGKEIFESSFESIVQVLDNFLRE